VLVVYEAKRERKKLKCEEEEDEGRDRLFYGPLFVSQTN